MLTFLAMGITVIMLAGDFAAINVSLTGMNNGTRGHWIINAYLIALSMFLVGAGSLADIFGRKKIFLSGLILFAIMSLLGAVARSFDILIAARFLQGMGSALMWPSIVGICYLSAPSEKKSFAMGLLLGAVGIGTALGLVMGDLLTHSIGWRAVLWINLPLSLIAGIVAYLKFDSRMGKEERKLDYLGLAIFSFGIFVLMYALQHSHLFGLFSLKLWGMLAFACFLIFLFFLMESKMAEPMISRSIMRNKSFIASALTLALISPAFFATLLYLPQFMQKFLGFSIYEAGFGLTPLLLIWAFVSPVAGDLSHYVGPKMISFIATAAIAVGTFLLGFVGAQSDYYFLLPGMIITGLGYGFGFSSITTAAVSSVEEKEVSTAVGVVYLFFVVGGAIGLALAYGIFYFFGENSLGTFQSQSYTRGFFYTMLITALLAAAGALLALLCIKRKVSETKL